MRPIKTLFKIVPTIVWLAIFLLGVVSVYLPKGIGFWFSGIIINNLYFPFYRIGLSLENYKNLYEENLTLKRDLAELSLTLERLREAERENDRLKMLLEFKSNAEYKLMLARVIGRADGSTITIDRGGADGVKVNMPVVHIKGIVGKVIYVSQGSSTVELYTNPNFMLSAIDARSRVVGIVQPNSKGELKMENVPIGSDVAYGDEIVSSGLGGVFPKGIPFGRVSRVFTPKDKMFMEIWVEPVCELSKLEEVFIITNAEEEGVKK